MIDYLFIQLIPMIIGPVATILLYTVGAVFILFRCIEGYWPWKRG